MRALDEALVAALDGLVPEGQLWRVEAPRDHPLPFLLYSVETGLPGVDTNFTEEWREFEVFVRAVALKAADSAALAEAVDTALTYARLAVAGWHAEPLTWRGLDRTPGRTLPDGRVVYEDGHHFSLRLQRTRSDS